MRRRATDPEDSNYYERRSGTFKQLNGHTRWVVAVVSVALVATLGALLSSEWRRIDSQSNTALVQTHKNEVALASLSAQLAQIQTTLEEIKHAVRDPVHKE